MNDSNKLPPRNSREGMFIQFEKMGVDQVRLKYGGAPPSGSHTMIIQVYGWAKEWLAPHEREARLSNEASQAESLATATSAKDAAWEAARAAKSANTIATLALVAAVIAIAISIVGVFLG